MDENLNDLEAGATTNTLRSFNKKMRKRKHLDALLKFRSKKTTPNDILRSSEDELFLPQQKSPMTKFRSSPYYRCWYYSKRILSFTLICIFTIICIALIYANIEWKNEVQNLSSRITEIEKKFSNVELTNISSMIKEIKTRLDLLEYENIPSEDDSAKLHDKSTRFLEINNSNEKAESMMNEKITEWNHQMNSFRKELQSFNKSMKIQELKIHLEQLTNFVHNSSDKTSVILTELQSNLDKLRNQIDECKGSKVNNENKPTESAIDVKVEQIVN